MATSWLNTSTFAIIRPFLYGGKPYVPEKIISILILRILKSVHISISPIFSCKLYPVAISEHPEPFLLENHVRIIALTPDIQKVSFYSIINLFYYSSTTKRLLSLIVVKESYPSSKASPLYRKSSGGYLGL
jgi:hypothetical protein